MLNFGDVPASSTLYIPFATYGKTNGESITMSGLAVTDIEIYKNGSTTQRASDNGYALLDTDGIDFDGITGLHGFSVDLSDNSDSGFYAVGSQYWVVVSTITVDSQTVTFVAARFRIRPAESQTGYPKVDAQYIEGTDATDQIRDSVVDDATRIDASALNTLSGHDPGETIMGATDLGTGSGLTSLATAAELAKVPKSDSNVTWNATAAAQIQSEANDAIVANKLDHLVAVADADDPVNDSIVAKLAAISGDWSDFAKTDHSLESIRDAAEVIDGIVDTIVARVIGTIASGTHQPQSGDAYAYLGTNLGLLGANATEAGGTGDQFSAIPWNAAWDAEVQSEVADGLTAFGWSGITVGTVTTLTNLPAITSNWLTAAGLATDAAAEIATALLTTQMTESYRATGAAPTLAQAQFEVIAHLGNSSIASTTKTAKKLDGSTTAKTYTLDSATTPTSITEAT